MEGSYAIITGATSGIGYELAKQAGKSGYNLVLIARDEEELERVQGQLNNLHVDIITISKDLFNQNAAAEIYAITTGMNLNVEVLINDAGQGQYGRFADEALGRHLDIIRLNVMSLVSLTHYYLNDMLIKGKGMVLQVGSDVSRIPGPMFAIYAATKAFVASFTEALINEIKDTGVTMTLLMPGATDTDFFDKAEMEDTKVYRESKMDSPAKVAELAFEALKNGDRRIIGPAGKKNIIMASLAPDNVLANSLRAKMEPSEKSPEETRQEPGHTRSRRVRDKNKGS